MPPFAVGGRHVRETATREGHQIFTNELMRFGERAGDPRISALTGGLRGPIRVDVRGRDGVGRATVAAALAGEGLVITGAEAAEVAVVVVAEALKPEDRAMIGRIPTLMVLNKADLAGFGAGGPIAVADRRAAELAGADRGADDPDGGPACRAACSTRNSSPLCARLSPSPPT